MIKITAITSGRRVPSSRFRVRQFIDPLKSHGFDVTEYSARPDKYVTRRVWPIGLISRLPAIVASRQSELTWIEREMVPGKFTAERFTRGRRVLDIDDALWLTNSSGFSEELASQCDGVIAGNETIAEHYRSHAAKVWIIPTSIDTVRWRPAEETRKQNNKWTIGWIGTSSNLPYLYEQEEPIADFLLEHAEAELLVVCDSKPSFRKIPPGSTRFERWSETNEVSLLHQMSVGLMPLPDTAWARGKCALKMIQYMSIGIPVLASPVGAARGIFDSADVGVAAQNSEGWYDGLKFLYDDPNRAASFGSAGRALAVKDYSVEANAQKLAAAFRDVLDG